MKKKAGRKSKYNSEILERVKCFARDGYTEEEMCQRLRVGHSSFNTWKKKYPEFLEALKENKEIVDNRVINSLLKRAEGFEYEEVETKEITFKMGGEGIPAVETKRTRKLCVPDVTAQIFWLKNRQKDDWREKRETEISGRNGGPIELKNTAISLEGLSDEDLEKLGEIASRIKSDNPGNDTTGKG